MLQSLAIRDIVLIETLDLDLQNGLTVLTGETGAGKSIVLDALGLALGRRSDRALVRQGAQNGSVSAVFAPPADHPIQALLAEHEIPEDDQLILRRSLNAEGRSRCFANDQAIGIGLLRQLGEALVEVHGQHDQRGLLDPNLHLGLLDAFAAHDEDVLAVRVLHRQWKDKVSRLQALQEELAAIRKEEAYLRNTQLELSDLAIQPGEEETLAEQRALLQQSEKVAGFLQHALAALTANDGVQSKLGGVQRQAERMPDIVQDQLQPVAQALDRALIEIGEVEAAIECISEALNLDPNALERLEERLFALRDASRKYRAPVDALPAILAKIERELAAIDTGADAVGEAHGAVRNARQAFLDAAKKLSAARHQAARQLAEAVTRELPPLKLERARFRVDIQARDEDDATADGLDKIVFEVSTNPGQPFGSLARIASGGELSRLMLALKVVLAKLDATPTLIFDEVDSGIGGSTAAAVGARLAKLGEDRQVFVVTHAPQVAARANHHFAVIKSANGETTSVDVKPLDKKARRDEIARMLAGTEVTRAARAAAQSLLKGDDVVLDEAPA